MNENILSDTDEVVILFQDGSERAEGFYRLAENSSFSYLVQVRNSNHSKISVDKRIDCRTESRVNLIAKVVNAVQQHDGTINIDISILSRFEFLFLLRMVYEIDRYDDIRLLYSEPHDYTTDQNQESTGIEKISSIPGFVNNAPLNRKLLLILFLGYEPARSMAIYNHIDPDETFLIIPDPPYQNDWEGRTEQLNANLINAVKSENIHRMHSSDPRIFRKEFEQFIDENGVSIGEFNCRISPLSTKPQSLGLFDYWRKNRGDFSLIYATPLNKKRLFDPVGIGTRHILKQPQS